MLHNCVYLAIVVQVLLRNNVIATKAFEVNISNATIRCNPAYLSANTSFNHGYRLSAEIRLLKPVPDVQFDFEIQIKPNNGREYQSLVKASKNFCDFARNPMAEPFSSIAFQMIRSNPKNHIIVKCPVLPGHYYIRDFEMKSDVIPGFIQNVKFNISYVVTFLLPQRVHGLTFEITGQYRNSNKPPRGNRKH